MTESKLLVLSEAEALAKAQAIGKAATEIAATAVKLNAALSTVPAGTSPAGPNPATLAAKVAAAPLAAVVKPSNPESPPQAQPAKIKAIPMPTHPIRGVRQDWRTRAAARAAARATQAKPKK